MNTPATMRALRQDSTQGPSDLRLVNIPIPVPGPDELLIRVAVAGVNFADVMQTYGTYGGGPVAPYLAGFEAAGEVVAVGSALDPALLGAQVIGSGPGAFAEYVTVPGAAALALPPGWTAEQSLGLVLNWATALAALRLGRLAGGESVVVPAAAGGVGQAAVRIARHDGAHVLALASTDKHELVRDLGVATVLDSSREDLVDVVMNETHGGADLVLEVGGGASFARSLAMTRPVTGRLVVYGTAGGAASVSNEDLVFRHRIQISGLHIGAVAAQNPAWFARLHAELLGLIEAGVYPPGQPQVFDLADGPSVLADLAARRTVGKLALRP